MRPISSSPRHTFRVTLSSITAADGETGLCANHRSGPEFSRTSFARGVLRRTLYEVPFGVAGVEGKRILSVTENPKHTHLINAGINIADPCIIEQISKDTYFDMTTLINDLIAHDLRVGNFPVHVYRVDIGTLEQLTQPRNRYGEVFGVDKLKSETAKNVDGCRVRKTEDDIYNCFGTFRQ